MIAIGSYVRVEKVDVPEDPAAETPSWDNHDEGSRNPGQSLPLQYTMTGELFSEIAEGEFLAVRRDTRNGKKAAGALRTSRIQSVQEDGSATVVETQNSVYRIEPIEDAPKEVSLDEYRSDEASVFSGRSRGEAVAEAILEEHGKNVRLVCPGDVAYIDTSFRAGFHKVLPGVRIPDLSLSYL